jgi:serine/threonine-protein kinase HipA
MTDTAFVFIYLPGRATPTVAGRFDLEAAISPAVGEFVYGESYLANPGSLPLDPVALPLRNEIFRTTLNSGLFGVVRDAIPDDWGRHVATKLYGEDFKTPFDYLWLPTGDRMGALACGRTPRAPLDEKPLLRWEGLENTAYLEAIRKLDRDVPLTPAEQEVALLFGAGTSAGGARPKFTTLRDDAVWLAKLNRHSDRFNEVKVEAAMLDLAVACGITVCEHRVVQLHGQDVLLVKRFDRTVTTAGIVRHRMVSAGTVFQADEAVAQYTFTGSYPRLARELGRWTLRGDEDRRELFRRITFNSLTSVTDDHERNHALIADGHHFRLSPAFDLVPTLSGTRKRYLSLVVGDFGALAIRDNLLSSAGVFELTRRQANDLIDEIQQTVRSQWRAVFADCEVSRADIERVSSCFDPPSFEAAPPDRAPDM